jgi:hypothetical protein
MRTLAALSPDGLLLAVGAEREVWLDRHGHDTDPTLVIPLSGPCVGVAMDERWLYALTEQGCLLVADHRGIARAVHSLGEPGVAVAARPGHAAVLTASGYRRLQGGAPGALCALQGGTSLGLSPGGAVAVGGQDGLLRVYGPQDQLLGKVALADEGAEGGVRGVCWAPEPEGPGAVWYATWGDRIFALAADGSSGRVLTRAQGMHPAQLAASPDGGLLAVLLEPTFALVLVLPSRDTVGQLEYMGRNAVGVALGGSDLLGVGLDQGDGNWLELRTAQLFRNDPPPGQDKRRWMVSVSADGPAVLARPSLHRPPPPPPAPDPEPPRGGAWDWLSKLWRR